MDRLDVVIALEHRFERTPDGAVWTQTAFSYPFWTRYLSAFERVRVVARVHELPDLLPGRHRVDGPGAFFSPLPGYVGPEEYVMNFRELKRRIRSICGAESAYILRVPGAVGSLVWSGLRGTGRPYALEVVGDPNDVFSRGAVRHPVRPFFRRWFTRRLKQQCAGACAAAYVTESVLQRRYPCPGYSVGISSIALPDAAIASSPRAPGESRRSFTLVTVGTLAQMYKAPDVLIDGVDLCTQEGLDLRLVLIGDGRHRAELERRADRRGLGERIQFLGELPAGEAVIAELDRADLFVLPSRVEGLPRAMIEAMARGLPCIGSTVGGIPELLPAEDMVPPGDAGALAQKMRDVLADPERMARMSARNLEKARDYREDTLGPRRAAFYKYVRDKTELWQNRQSKAKAASKGTECSPQDDL